MKRISLGTQHLLFFCEKKISQSTPLELPKNYGVILNMNSPLPHMALRVEIPLDQIQLYHYY